MARRKQFNHPDEQQLVTRLGVRVQFLRLERGFSLRNVAKRAECSVSALASIEHGRCAASTRTLEGIAKALDVKPFDLLNFDTNDSDVGFLLEAMRQNPECINIVNERISSLA